MKALPDEKLPEDDFVYEIKFEGYRVLAFSKPLGQVAETETAVLLLYQPAGEITRALGSRDYAGDDATLPVGQTRADRPGQVYRVDKP